MVDIELKSQFGIINHIMGVKELTHEQKLEICKGMKRKLRRDLAKERSNRNYVSSDCESCYTKEWHNKTFTEQEKREYIEDKWVRIYSMYDCTGKWFTKRIYICNLKEPNSFGARSVVYHFMGIDV